MCTDCVSYKAEGFLVNDIHVILTHSCRCSFLLRTVLIGVCKCVCVCMHVWLWLSVYAHISYMLWCYFYCWIFSNQAQGSCAQGQRWHGFSCTKYGSSLDHHYADSEIIRFVGYWYKPFTRWVFQGSRKVGRWKWMITNKSKGSQDVDWFWLTNNIAATASSFTGIAKQFCCGE